MQTFKHCDRPGLNCRQLVMSDHFIQTQPLKAIQMWKLFRYETAYNSCSRFIIFENNDEEGNFK